MMNMNDVKETETNPIYEAAHCTLCPRKCGADRSAVGEACRSFCGADALVRIARVGLHEWEEPVLSYGKGSGTVFFSGCSLKCVFCQNHEISAGLKGRDISPSELPDIFLKVRDMGASNLNLVNPTHYVREIRAALEKVKGSLGIPVVYNTGGYDRVEALQTLDGLVDIYLPDMKYVSSEYSKKYSGAADYFAVASNAVAEMFRQVGYPAFDAEGHMTHGTLVRHLVLPGLCRDSFAVLEHLAQNYDVSRLYVSIMRQYFPCHKAFDFPEISRKLTGLEYDKVLEYAEKLGITHGFAQERSSAREEYVPAFDF